MAPAMPAGLLRGADANTYPLTGEGVSVTDRTAFARSRHRVDCVHDAIDALALQAAAFAAKDHGDCATRKARIERRRELPRALPPALACGARGTLEQAAGGTDVNRVIDGDSHILF